MNAYANTVYEIVPKDYVCPICGHNFWDLDCPHSEWHIIQHFEKVVRMYANHDNWAISLIWHDPGRYNRDLWKPIQHGYTLAEEALK